MNRSKSEKSGGRDEPVEDPKLLQETLRLLCESEMEFSIKVEGTSTLPYAARLQAIERGQGAIILKLVRPLPHELMGGALFQATFAVEDQRYEALISYLQREAYLQYRFSPPERLFSADRRRAKRYPFRPRESAYVIASDGGVPGLGVAGPLVNIGPGGLCLRVDRVLKLDDGLRIPPGTALFERGTSFPRLRIQDLPRLPLLEVAGWVAHVQEHGSEIRLGFDFGEVDEVQARALGDCLAFRDKLFRTRSPGTPSDTGGAIREPSMKEQKEAFPTPEPGPVGATGGLSSEPLRLLARKTARLMLVGPEDTLLARCQEGLWRCGYHRLELVRDCEAARSRWQEAQGTRPKLVLLAISVAGVGDQEPLAAVRQLEKAMTSLGDVPTVIVCEDIDPTLLLGQTPGTHFLPCGRDVECWIPILDELLGFSEA